MIPFLNDWSHAIHRLSFKHFHPNKFSALQLNRAAFDAHRCLFIHVPKCAGIALGRSLFGENYVFGHPTLKQYQVVFSRGEFNAYFKFTVVRNPFDRLASAFFFLKNGGMNPNDRNWAQENLAPYDSFDIFVKQWVNAKNIRSACHFQPQCDFICLEDSHRTGMDFIGFYENLEADFKIICRKLRVDATLLVMNRNSSRSRDYRECYTDETRAVAAEVYADDLRVLGYSFDNSSLPDQLARRGADGRAKN